MNSDKTLCDLLVFSFALLREIFILTFQNLTLNLPCFSTSPENVSGGGLPTPGYRTIYLIAFLER
jgi:hypothetical protein